MDLDVHTSLKAVLAKAQTFEASKDWPKAASAYEKAANLMSMWAEQAHGRDAEERRKKKALEYRAYAARLRNGETSEAPAPAAEAPSKNGGPPGPANELKSIVSNLSHVSQITWADIGGLEETKNEIKFALGMTLAQQPAGVRIAAWTRILFYGPPGTGKTLLAAATSNAVRSTEDVPSVFYNVKVSSILSKYFGESSKILSELYGTARDTSPSVVFLDEFESLAGKRDSGDSGAERRILSTLLSELDGMEGKGRSDIYVMTIAATNRPWDLDAAVLSRFEKKILIPLPDVVTREKILRIHLEKKGYPIDVPYPELAGATDGYSGREIERFCKEVTTGMIEEMNRDIPALVDRGLDAVKKHKIKVRPLTKGDVDAALRQIHPQTTAEEMKKYYSWKESAEEA
ncbi:MAG TPA: ATP-binding protein [Planctomycetota bacterium]